MAVSRKAMTEGLSKWASSDPLSLVLAGDARDSMNYGMIATGNHFNFDSLRGAPPLVSKGSLGRPMAAPTDPYDSSRRRNTDCHTSLRTGSQ